METKHTPGEWKLQNDSPQIKEHTIEIRNHKHEWICSIIPFGRKTKEEFEANSKLIAAAPDLLAAALQIKNEIDTEGLLQESYKKLLEAIEKATK